MKKFLLLFTLVLVQLLCFGASAQTTYTAGGVVKDEAGNPVEGVDIYASPMGEDGRYGSWTGTAKTDAEGKWTITGLEAATYQFRALGPDWFNTGYNNGVVIDGNKEDINFTLAEKTSTITPTVWISNLSGKVPEAHVELWSQDETPVLVGESDGDASGNCQSISVKGELKTYTVKATAEGYKDYTADYKPTKYGQNNSLSILMQVAPPTYTAGGVVKNEDGNPVEGVDIYASPMGEDGRYGSWTGTAKTDTEGKWIITGLEAATYQFRALGPDWFNTGYNNGVVIDGDKEDIDFTLAEKTSTITPTVWISNLSGKVPEAHVELWSQDETPVLVGESDGDASGNCQPISVKGELKTYTVKATAEGYKDYTADYKPTKYGQNNSLSILMQVAPPTYAVSGVVKDEDENLVADAEILVRKKDDTGRYGTTGINTRTAEDGTWSVSLENGDYQFQVMADGYNSSFSTMCTVTDADVTGLETVLKATTTTIGGTFYNKVGFATIEGGHIEFWTQGENPEMVGEADGDLSGRYSGITLKGVTGTYNVIATAPGYVKLEVEYTPKNGQSNTYSPMMEKASKLSGSVKDEDENVVAGAQIFVNKKGADDRYTRVPDLSAVSAEDGTFSLELGKGDYQLMVMADGYKTNFATYVTVTNEDIDDVAVVLNYTETGISGSFYNKETLAKIEGGHIEFWTQGENPELVAEADGDLSGDYPLVIIKGVTGTYDVKATAPGYEPYTGTCKPTNGQTSNKCSPMMKALPPVVTASGVVKDADGKGVEGADIYVSLKGEDGRYETLADVSATTDASGAWSIADLSVGTYQFRALKEGYKAVFNNDVELSADKTDVDFTLAYEESTITGTIRDNETLTAVAGGHVELWSQGENPELLYQTDGNSAGKYSVKVYGPFQTFTVKATAPGYEDYEGEYTPTLYGQDNTHSIMLTATELTFTAMVKGNQENGESVLLDKAEVTVTSETDDDNVEEIETTNEGNGFYTFTVKGYEAIGVTYSVKVTCSGYDGEEVYTFSFNGKDVEHEFVLNQTVGLAIILQEMSAGTPIYTINGVRVNANDVRDLAPGIYVVGDRKVIVK